MMTSVHRSFKPRLLVAAANGGVLLADQLLAVNGKSLAGLSHGDVLKLLQSTVGIIRLRIARRIPDPVVEVPPIMAATPVHQSAHQPLHQTVPHHPATGESSKLITPLPILDQHHALGKDLRKECSLMFAPSFYQTDRNVSNLGCLCCLHRFDTKEIDIWQSSRASRLWAEVVIHQNFSASVTSA